MQTTPTSSCARALPNKLRHSPLTTLNLPDASKLLISENLYTAILSTKELYVHKLMLYARIHSGVKYTLLTYYFV